MAAAPSSTTSAVTGVAAATQDSLGPILAVRKPFLARARLMLRLLAFKAIVRVAFNFARTFRITRFGQLRPTYTKAYSVGSRLVNDVWLPSGYVSGSTLPLFINIHGGGFALGDPRMDAPWCQHLADAGNFCVVSVNYRKTPFVAYPAPTQDLVEIVLAILADKDLPVDSSNVAIGGFSAGGNLALSACLRDELRGKIKGILSWYPVTDFSGRFKGDFGVSASGEEDVLKRTSEMFNYGYVNPGTDKTEPGLSPVYGDRSKLPPKIFFIGCEYDVLCNEARVTAEKYAKAEGKKQEGDENSWVAGGIRWLRVLGVQHGFNLQGKRDKVAEAYRVKMVDETYATCVEWLRTEVYGQSPASTWTDS